MGIGVTPPWPTPQVGDLERERGMDISLFMGEPPRPLTQTRTRCGHKGAVPERRRRSERARVRVACACGALVPR